MKLYKIARTIKIVNSNKATVPGSIEMLEMLDSKSENFLFRLFHKIVTYRRNRQDQTEETR